MEDNNLGFVADEDIVEAEDSSALNNIQDFLIKSAEGTGVGSLAAGAGRVGGELISQVMPDSEVDAQLKAQGFTIDDKQNLLDEYYKGKEQFGQLSEQAAERSPALSTLGTLAGAGSSMALPIGAASTTAGRIAAGAGAGALANTMSGDARLLEGDFAGTAEEAALGAGLGAGIGAGVEALPLVAVPFKKAGEFASEKISKIEPIQELIELYKRSKAGINLADKKAIGPLAEKSSEVAEEVLQPVTQNMQEVSAGYEQLKASPTRFDLQDTLQKSEQELAMAPSASDEARMIKEDLLKKIQRSGKAENVDEISKLEKSLEKPVASKEELKQVSSEIKDIESRLKSNNRDLTLEETDAAKELLNEVNILKKQKDDIKLQIQEVKSAMKKADGVDEKAIKSMYDDLYNKQQSIDDQLKEYKNVESTLKKGKIDNTPLEKQALLEQYNALKAKQSELSMLAKEDESILAKLGDLKSSKAKDLTFEEAKQIQSQFKPSAQMELEAPGLAKRSRELEGTIKQELKKNTELSGLEDKFSKNKDVLEAAGYDINDYNLDNLTLDQQKAIDALGSKILGAAEETGKVASLQSMKRVTDRLEDVLPKEKLTEVVGKIGDVQKDVDLYRKYSGALTNIDLTKPLSTVTKAAGKIAGAAGKYVPKWYENTESLRKVAGRAQGKFGSYIGDLSNPEKRTAANFALMQMPGFRELLRSEGIEE